MRIGLISDTHIPSVTKVLPAQIKEIFRNVDLIMHAGDIYWLSVLDELERLAPVLAAEGDDDFLDLELLRDKRVKRRHILNIEGVTIWLLHEYEVWAWDTQWNPPGVIVFGHTHEASLENNGGILKVCPGSPTFPHYKPEPGTLGLLTLNAGKAEAEIIQLR